MKHFIFLAFVLLLFLSGCVPLSSSPQSSSDQRLQEFSTSEELTAFLKEHQQSSGSGGRDTIALQGMESDGAPTAAKASAETGGSSYSQTNVQVQGVDEADIVKNDGKYIYTLTQNKLVIVDAYPPNTATITSTIEIPGQLRDLFINKNRLVVFTDLYQPVYTLFKSGMMEDEELPVEANAKMLAPGMIRPEYYQSPKTGVLIYDTTDKEDPELVANYTVDGNYYQSRMIGDYVYMIAQHAPYYGGGPIPLPALRESNKLVMESPVSYFDNWEPQINFNSIAAFNVFDTEDVNLQTFMLGYANTLYVSQNNMYITYQKQSPYDFYYRDQESRFTKIIMPLLPADLQKEMRTLMTSDEEYYLIEGKLYTALEEHYNNLPQAEREALQKKIDQAVQDYDYQQQEERMKTIVHKFSLQEGIVKYEEKGEIKGTLLNQFSLDEYKNHLRVATTTSLYSSAGQKMYNNVYVLDDDLEVVGQVEEIAPEERIYSTRFIGDRLYMVTFKQVDPLFVIDLADPAAPKILGQLKIPGFSNYLHPYDEDHIIGIGQDTVEEVGRTVTGGLKIALFDVSDVNNPKEQAKLIIGNRGTYSEVFSDHKAFLLDTDRDLVIFPVSETKDANWQHVWQGVYVLRVKPDIGFVVLSRITHGTYDPSKPYDTYSTQVRRALYINDILYTLSPSKIKMNSLKDFKDEYKTISLPYKEDIYGSVVY